MSPGKIDQLMQVIVAGRAAEEELIGAIYDELRQVAHRKMRNERANQTVDATEVLHEALLRLRWQDMAQKDHAYLYTAVARAMMRVFIERGRVKQRRAKRLTRVPWDVVVDELEKDLGADLIDLEPALKALGNAHPRQQAVFILVQAGYTRAEVAERLGIAATTAGKDFDSACEFLRASLRDQES